MGTPRHATPTPAPPAPVVAPPAPREVAPTDFGSAEVTPDLMAAGQDTYGNAAVAAVLAYREADSGRDAVPTEHTIIDGEVCPSCHPGKKGEIVDPGVDEMQDAAYRAVIASLESAQDRAVGALRAKAAGLPEPARTAADGIIEVIDDSATALVWQVMFEIGVTSGFAEGLVDAIVGIRDAGLWLCVGLGSAVIDALGDPVPFAEWWSESERAFDGLPGAIADTSAAWLVSFKAAPAAERAALIGELCGQLVAVFAPAKAAASSLGDLKIAMPGGPTPGLAAAGAGGGVTVVAGSAGGGAFIAGEDATTAGLTFARGAIGLGAALGAGPESRAMHTVQGGGAMRSAGMTGADRHHVLPQEHADWFADHGINVDDWCVEVPPDEHMFLHEQGWNDELMEELEGREAALQADYGPDALLSVEDILAIADDLRAKHGLDSLPYVSYDAP